MSEIDQHIKNGWVVTIGRGSFGRGFFAVLSWAPSLLDDPISGPEMETAAEALAALEEEISKDKQ